VLLFNHIGQSYESGLGRRPIDFGFPVISGRRLSEVRFSEVRVGNRWTDPAVSEPQLTQACSVLCWCAHFQKLWANHIAGGGGDVSTKTPFKAIQAP
jgi:hypothetical protein